MRRRLLAEINTIPFVDVALVLLVTFMVATPILYTTLPVELPRAGGRPTGLEEPPLLLILEEKRVRLRWRTGEAQVPLDHLPALLLAYRSRYPEVRVVVAAEATVPYRDVAALLDRLKRAGLDEVGLLTQPP